MTTLTAKDFASDQDVRWCPGCGDYAILASIRKVLPRLGHAREEHVFVSGIGCAARFPYYMSTYGMHTIHGRAPAFATGVKLANPHLQVWICSGDGDLLSIGGNHTIHLMRRNVDVNVVLFNNRIYGLTKGQTSPTSEFGKRTKTTPYGSVDRPVNPLELALGAGCTFVARAIDVDAPGLEAVLQRGAEHRGTAFTEVWQDCNIFNHGIWFPASKKESRPDHVVELAHGQPLIFGAEREKGIALRHGRPTVVRLGVDATEDDLIVHDEHNRGMAFLLAGMRWPDHPEPIGVLYHDPEPAAYESLVHAQIDDARRVHGDGDLASLYGEGETWEV